MNIEDYFAASRPIHESLAQISSTVWAMALSHCANPTNPQFTSLMQLHAQQIDLFRKLHEAFVNTNAQLFKPA